MRVMAGADAQLAFQKMILLAQRPKQTVNLLEEKFALTLHPETTGKTVRGWIDDLRSDQFTTRSQASGMLRKIGPATTHELRAALPTAKNLETRRRIEELIASFSDDRWAPVDVLHSRAVEVLEAIGTHEARFSGSVGRQPSWGRRLSAIRN